VGLPTIFCCLRFETSLFVASYDSSTELNRLILFRETVAVFVRIIRNTQIHWVCRMQSSVIYKNSVRTSQETYYVFAAETNRLMLFRETVALYCKNHAEYIYALCVNKLEPSFTFHSLGTLKAPPLLSCLAVAMSYLSSYVLL
jgi:hypothetical protein